jgi:23S rRNA pseudouridine1911/1915/1917 synthase
MSRVIDVLREQGLSPRLAREAMTSGKVRLRGVPVADGGRFCTAAELKYDPSAPRVQMGRDAIFLQVSPRWVVVWKPSGMLSVRAPGREGEPTVVGAVARQFGEAHAVHRLDEGTSGCMLVARDPEAQEALKALFEAHNVERRYLALAHGRVAREPRRIQSVLIRDRGDGRRGSAIGPSREGKPAETEITGLQPVQLSGGACTLVEARLFTGRTHQVRIHLSEAGTPVLGDSLYAPRAVSERFPRLALHAAVLGFADPFTGAAVRWDTGLPDDIDRAVRGATGSTS